MAPITDIQQFAVPVSPETPETQYPGYEAYPEVQPTPETDFSLNNENQPDGPAPYLTDPTEIYDAQRAAVEVARSGKAEANAFNPEAIYSFVEGAGARIAGLRKHHVALQDDNFINVLRNKLIS